MTTWATRKPLDAPNRSPSFKGENRDRRLGGKGVWGCRLRSVLDSERRRTPQAES